MENCEYTRVLSWDSRIAAPLSTAMPVAPTSSIACAIGTRTAISAISAPSPIRPVTKCESNAICRSAAPHLAPAARQHDHAGDDEEYQRRERGHVGPPDGNPEDRRSLDILAVVEQARPGAPGEEDGDRERESHGEKA